ncbi:transposase [Rubritalea spongiae]|uniref:Transposase n=1 Tax=Rubritalea spongiae TaxID=430797 RepID=A0ABW5E012_9BACT
MAKARILAPWVGKEEKSAIYHCVSRVVERRFHFKKLEKEQFIKFMRLYEAFCGVRVLSYCVMSNHFHLLVEVPPRPEGGLSDAELLDRLGLVMPSAEVEVIAKSLALLSSAAATPEGQKAYDQLRERYFSRMWDLGQFMKSLKQRFSRWFNKAHQRKGTLWEERYNSALIEEGHVARVTAAYIDLNPVRAGMVEDPKDYRWCGYAEAVAGGEKARLGIARVLEKCDDEHHTQQFLKSSEVKDRYAWRKIAGRYRLGLYEDARAPGESEQAKALQGSKINKRKGFSEDEIKKEQARAGELSAAELVSSRAKFLIDGAVIGSQSFVNGVIAQLNDNGYWPKPRVSKASRCQRSVSQAPIYTLRQLQLE